MNIRPVSLLGFMVGMVAFVVVLVPSLVILIESVSSPERIFSLQAYETVFASRVARQALMRTFEIAIAVTLISIVAGYPLAFAIAASKPRARSLLLAWDERYALLTVVIASFGRAISEVGAVMIVGGNMEGFTRVMTTAIALETSKGDLPLALALGLILLAVVLVLNLLLAGLRRWREGEEGMAGTLPAVRSAL